MVVNNFFFIRSLLTVVFFLKNGAGEPPRFDWVSFLSFRLSLRQRRSYVSVRLFLSFFACCKVQTSCCYHNCAAADGEDCSTDTTCGRKISEFCIEHGCRFSRDNCSCFAFLCHCYTNICFVKTITIRSFCFLEIISSNIKTFNFNLPIIIRGKCGRFFNICYPCKCSLSITINGFFYIFLSCSIS